MHDINTLVTQSVVKYNQKTNHTLGVKKDETAAA
jgi:hypothetical protein